MLDRIDSIDWKSLTHAYGSAEDVPDLIRALTAKDEQTRDAAFKKLWCTIIHQGTVYEATAYAVPFLIELLREPGVGEKDRILRLVTMLGCGNSYHQVHQNLFREPPVGLDEIIRRELAWVEAARIEAGKGAPVFLAMLECDDVRLRMDAAYALALCQEQSQEIAPLMCRHVTNEADAVVRCCLLLSLRVVGNPSCRAFLESCLGSSDPAVSYAAAQALAEIAQADMPDEAIGVLCDVFANPFQLDEVYSQVPWSDGVSAESRAGSALRMVGPSAASKVVERLLDILDDLVQSDSRNDEIVWTVLVLAFIKPQQDSKVADLTPYQRQVSKRLASNSAKIRQTTMAGFLGRAGLTWSDLETGA